jgi:hypothetical protein
VAFETKTIPVGKLMLDTENPRHEKVASQDEAISALIASERQKLVVLASDVLEFGLSPIDRLLVLKAGRRYTVVEGNRRLAVVKILNNPSLAEGTPIEGQMKRLSGEGPTPAEADCAIAPSRKDAKHWMGLRHGGEAEGAGVVPWNTFAANRFAEKPNREAGAAIRFLEEVERAYPKNDVMQSLIRDVANKRLTTLGRLVLDSNFQQRAGMVDSGGSPSFHFSAKDLEAFLEYVLGDLASNVGVSVLRKKPDRAKYLKSTPEPDRAKRQPKAAALSASPTTNAKPKPKRPTRPSKPPKPFRDLDLSKLGERTENILREFQGIDVDLRPNAAALLTRAILELSVDQYIAKKKLSTEGKLKKRIQRALNSVDTTQKDRKFQGVRQGLADSNNMFAVATLHGYVHNPHFHPDGSGIRSIAANLSPFLQALNDDV